MCLQETKCAEKSLPADITSMPEYPHKYWAGSDDKEGYSGVAMLSKTEPLKVTYGIGEYRSGRKLQQQKTRNCCDFCPQSWILILAVNESV